jgi:hypothetical protein
VLLLLFAVALPHASYSAWCRCRSLQLLLCHSCLVPLQRREDSLSNALAFSISMRCHSVSLLLLCAALLRCYVAALLRLRSHPESAAL